MSNTRQPKRPQATTGQLIPVVGLVAFVCCVAHEESTAMEMKFNVSISTVKTFGQNEKEKDRLARMRAFWASPTNAVLVTLGRLLNQPLDATQSCADYLADPAHQLEVSEVTANGVTYPVVPTQVISLATVTGKSGSWGCPACSSAHGSGVYPSREVSSKGLSENRWYYNPATKQVHTISSTCYDKYAVGIIGKDRLEKRLVTGLPKVVAKGELVKA